jgi:hypothetical protein
MEVRDVLAVSSGTMAALTGFREGASLDTIVAAWAAYEESHSTEGDWRDSWRAFLSSDGYREVMLEVVTARHAAGLGGVERRYG